MGVYIIKMPDIGEGIAEVELVEWHVAPGDTVTEDQVLADVMTDKATVQVPSPVDGTVLALGGRVGEVMPVGSELIRLETEGGGALEEAATEAQPAPTPKQVVEAGQQVEAGGAPEAAQVAEAGQEIGQTTEAKPEPAVPAAGPAPILAKQLHAARPLASPAVRRRALDEGIDLRMVPGTGSVGQVTHEDLDRWLQYAGQGPAAVAVATSGGTPMFARREGVEDIPVVGLRRKIAQKMQQSKRNIPHFTYVEEIDVTELEALRMQLNQRWAESRGRLTMLPFLARAMVLALRDFPQMNARYDDEKGVVQRYAPVHLGVAAQTDAGLMVPVLRHAESYDLWAMASEVRRLAQEVRSGTAKRDELSGSTITLTSLGALGGIVSTPVINYPEVAIVGVNRVVERPMVLDGAVVVRKMMNLSSSFDHRVVDGMHAAEFIQSIRAYLECPSLLFVE